MEGFGPNSVACDFKTIVARIAAAGNKPEDWKEYIDVVKARAQIMEESRKNRLIGYVYISAFKAIPETYRTLAHAQLLIDYAEFRSLQDQNEAEKLLSYGRRILRQFATVHVASAELELNRGNREKATRVLQKSLSLGAEPVAVISTALRRLNEGKTRLFSDSLPENNTEYNLSHGCGMESSEEWTNSQLSGTFGMSKDIINQTLPSCKSNTQEVQQDLDILTQYHNQQPVISPALSSIAESVCDGTLQSIPNHQHPKSPQPNSVFGSTLKSPEPPVLLYKGFLDAAKESHKTAADGGKFHLGSGLGSASIPETPQHHRLPNETFESSTSKRSLYHYHSTPDMRQMVGSAIKGSISKFRPLNLPPPRRVKVDPALRNLQDDDGDEHNTQDITVSAFEPLHTKKNTPVYTSENNTNSTDGAATYQASDSKFKGHIGSLPVPRFYVSPLTSTGTPVLNKVNNEPEIRARIQATYHHSGQLKNVPYDYLKKQEKNMIRYDDDDDDDDDEAKEPYNRTDSHTNKNKDVNSQKQSPLSDTFGHIAPVGEDHDHFKKQESNMIRYGDEAKEPYLAADTHTNRNMSVPKPSPLSVSNALNRIAPAVEEIMKSASDGMNVGKPNSGGPSVENVSPEIKADSSKDIIMKEQQLVQIVQKVVLEQQLKQGCHSTSHSVPNQQPLLESQVPVAASSVLTGQKTVYVNNKPYTVMKLIGRGGSAKVYQVYEPQANLILALKCVNLGCANQVILEGYKNEIDLLKKLQHCDKVIKLYDSEYVAASKKLFVVLEYGETDLSKFISQNENNQQALNPITVCYFWFQMVTAVHAMHKEGVIHSDLKPANFILVSGQVKLIDFGIANSLQQDSTSVMKENMVGTPSYMSPEALMAINTNPSDLKPKYKVGVRSDIWSLGCILYQMVYGHTPFQHVRQKLMAIVDPAHSISFPDKRDPALMDILKKCLTRDVRLRPATDELLAHPYLQKQSAGEVATPNLASRLSQLESLIDLAMTSASPRTQQALVKRLKDKVSSIDGKLAHT